MHLICSYAQARPTDFDSEEEFVAVWESSAPPKAPKKAKYAPINSEQVCSLVFARGMIKHQEALTHVQSVSLGLAHARITVLSDCTFQKMHFLNTETHVCNIPFIL